MSYSDIYIDVEPKTKTAPDVMNVLSKLKFKTIGNQNLIKYY